LEESKVKRKRKKEEDRRSGLTSYLWW
jgi:hypothetical protein